MKNINISYDSGKKTFYIFTEHTSYVMGVLADRLVHLYYGARIPNDDISFMAGELRTGWPVDDEGEKVSLMDSLPLEYPTEGSGDYRENALAIRSSDGHRSCDLKYDSYEIVKGKPEISGLPSTKPFDDALTLIIRLTDEALNVEVSLYYSVYGDSDALMRRSVITNRGEHPLWIERVMSACLDIPEAGVVSGYHGAAGVANGCGEPVMDVLTLNGTWAKERHIDRRHIGHGVVSAGSKRGISSHQSNPFFAVMEGKTTDTSGGVYAMNLVYSGDHYLSVEMDPNDRYRMTMGIHPENFSWKLEPGGSFESPEAVIVYSERGIDGMTHVFHDLYRNHLLPEKWKYRERPVIINNWEATYFDFDEKKIFDIASLAAESGIELFVLDDGWFGERHEPKGGLGDWLVNENKLHGGMKKLVDSIHGLGMKFGLWFEPEMVSPESELYRAHPEWALRVNNREISQSRNQYVLDMSRPEVVDYIYGMVSKVIRENGIDYVKWDMNRPLADIGSEGVGSDRQGEIKHRYVMGVYEMQGRLVRDFPELLLENCAGGGSRFDPGMMYFSPQIWCSDNMDPVERLMIQEGTALVYPLSVTGAHVCDCPNHIVGRTTPFETRGAVACQGAFGYELDITKIDPSEVSKIPAQIAMYKKHVSLIQGGDYYRLSSYAANHRMDAYQIVSKDKTKSIVSYVQVMAVPNAKADVIRLKGLDPDKKYDVRYVISESEPTGNESDNILVSAEPEERVLHGSTLMNTGLIMHKPIGDFKAVIVELSARS
ncbi:MAG: alpha-galactosidase [Eubacterium sp.]|nr:alpha-galactosidase [Eubacterium sp.]